MSISLNFVQYIYFDAKCDKLGLGTIQQTSFRHKQKGAKREKKPLTKAQEEKLSFLGNDPEDNSLYN